MLFMLLSFFFFFLNAGLTGKRREMLWKYLWKPAYRRRWLEDWKDKDIPKGLEAYKNNLSWMYMVWNTEICVH